MDMDHKLFCARERLAASDWALEDVRVKLHDSKARYALIEEMVVRTRCEDCPEKCSHFDDLEWVRKDFEALEGLIEAGSGTLRS